MLGLTVIAVAHAGMAQADLSDSDIWIGFAETDNGFLLDEASGDVWMTGPCLKPLNTAVRADTVWTSHTVELVSVGRAMALLDQQFELDVQGDTGTITVTSNGRGGLQSFPAIVDRNCETGGQCARLIRTQEACQG